MNFITDTIEEIKSMKPRSVSTLYSRKSPLRYLKLTRIRCYHLVDLPSAAILHDCDLSCHDLELHEADPLD